MTDSDTDRFRQRKAITASNPAEAHFIQGLLHNEGIFAEIRNEHLYGAHGEVPVWPDNLPQIWILESDAERAAEILRHYYVNAEPVGTGPKWACPRCGEILEPQFTQCWRCSTERPDSANVDNGDSAT